MSVKKGELRSKYIGKVFGKSVPNIFIWNVLIIVAHIFPFVLLKVIILVQNLFCQSDFLCVLNAEFVCTVNEDLSFVNFVP